jgi:cleavage and polyadenylation specificity factor subunit 2
LPHLGYFPFARAQLGLTCPVYATVPVASMGRVSCAEECEGWRQEMDGSLWEEEDFEEERKEVNDETETGGKGPDEVGKMDVDGEGKRMIETKVTNGKGGLKRGREEATEVLVKKKMKRKKWVATSQEVVDAFESITRVKYESPTRLMGMSASLYPTLPRLELSPFLYMHDVMTLFLSRLIGRKV